METSTKHKLYIISAAVAAGCTFSYFILITRKRIHLDAMDMFNYLNIKIATTEECCDQIVAELRGRCQQYKALGFDCEWVTDKGKKKPVALVQLSSMDGLCGLFRLNCVKTMPQSLKTLLEDKSIYKVGVAVTDDSRYLKQDYLVTLESALDLRHLAKLVGYDTGGLASLSKTLLGVILDKSWRVRCSNWEAETLSQKQSQYAATDAHVAIKIFAILIKQLYSQDSTFSWLQMMWNKDCVWSSVDKYCSKYSDINFKSKPNGAKLKLDLNGKDTKVNKENRRYPNATRSKPLYHNCFLQAPDGEVLCTCDNKKALWYVQKQLADVVSQEPLSVRLRFEPAGRSVGEVGRYYQLTKENKCVICGGTNSYIRKNVVPREYRKYFPEVMKDHSSHDVVLLCTECHRRSNVRDQAMRERLAALCSAPLPTHRHTKYSEDAICKKIKSAARALLYQTQKHVLPDARRKELEDILLQYYPLQDQITNELLQEAAELQVMFENDNYESHGLKVVEYFLEHEGLLRLEQIWRQHFLDCMQPKYMPALWSVTHNDERLRVKWNEGRLTERDLKSIGLTTWVA